MKIENFGKLEGYVENKEEVLKILENVNFEIGYDDEQDDWNGYNYIITIERNSIKQDFKYREGMAHDTLTDENEQEKIISALHCILTDLSCIYGRTVIDFIEEFGYDNIRDGEKVFNNILEEERKIKTLFSQDEIDIMQENIQL